MPGFTAVFQWRKLQSSCSWCSSVNISVLKIIQLYRTEISEQGLEEGKQFGPILGLNFKRRQSNFAGERISQ